MTKEVKEMNKYICLINEMYNNNIRLHTPLQNIDSDMPTELLEILSVSDGIEEVISVGERDDESIYLFDAIDGEEEYFAKSLAEFWDINTDVAQNNL